MTHVNDQADGFYSDIHPGYVDPHCLPPDSDSGKGKPEPHEPDVWTQTHGRVHFRLVKGFNLMNASERGTLKYTSIT